VILAGSHGPAWSTVVLALIAAVQTVLLAVIARRLVRSAVKLSENGTNGGE